MQLKFHTESAYYTTVTAIATAEAHFNIIS